MHEPTARPPLGVQSRHLWLEGRVRDLIAAAHRAFESNVVPDEKLFLELKMILPEYLGGRFDG